MPLSGQQSNLFSRGPRQLAMEGVAAGAYKESQEPLSGREAEGPFYKMYWGASSFKRLPEGSNAELIAAAADSTTPTSAFVPTLGGEGQRRRLFVSFNVSGITDIRASEECFLLTLRMYMFWKPDWTLEAMEPHLTFLREAHAADSGVRIIPDDATDNFLAAVGLPDISFANAKDTELVDNATVRVYARHGFVMHNAAYKLVMRHTFSLRSFPFDRHGLPFDIRLNSANTWDKYELSIFYIRFSVPSLHQAEWAVKMPSTTRPGSEAVRHRGGVVHFRVVRAYSFYLRNVYFVVYVLSLISLVVFALPEDDLADRVGHILTLLLTAVAFKFVIADSIPKVGYSTDIDTFTLHNLTFLVVIVLIVTVQAILVNSGVGGDAALSSTRNLVCLGVALATLMVITVHTGWKIYHAMRGQALRWKAFKPSAKQNWIGCAFADPFFSPGGRNQL